MEAFRMVILLGLVGMAISASPISEDIFTLGSGMRMGNTLKTRNTIFTNCPIDFTKQNYTIITSVCKPPKYDAVSCCTSFKQFACPLADQVNKIKANYCALLMFKALRTYAKIKSPILFLDKCQESKLGMSCDDVEDSEAGSPAPQPAPRSP